MKFKGNYLLICKAYILVEGWQEAKVAWCENYTDFPRAVYFRDEENSILEIIAIDNLSEIENVMMLRESFDIGVRKLMRSDWHNTLLEYKEDLKSTIRPIPTSDFIELRHIEVPLNVYEEYKEWRKRTIYQHLGAKNEIDVFSYYHTVIGDKPGVYFLVGFSTNVDDYCQIYQEPEYQNILDQAGKKYISGGLSGLSTEIYKRLEREDMQ